MSITSKYHPSLLIMAKNVGFSYLNTTEVLDVDSKAGSATSETVSAEDEATAGESDPPQEQELLQILDEVDPAKKPRKGLKDTQKPFAYHEEGLKSLSVVWDHCNAADIEQYKDWYKQANADCHALTAELKPEIDKLNPPDAIKMIIGLVAATSQGTLWEENLDLVRRIIKEQDLSKFKVKKPGVKIDEDAGELKITGPNLGKVRAILAGDFSVLETDKFGAFNASIENPSLTQNTVVVDTHAAGIWIGRRLGVQDKKFQENKPEGARLAAIVRDYRKLAAKVGYSAQSVQAVTWSVWRKLPPNYETKYMKYGEKHPEVEMFKAFYPFLYAAIVNPETGKVGKKANWRWRYDRFNDLLRPKDLPTTDQTPVKRGEPTPEEPKGPILRDKKGKPIKENPPSWMPTNEWELAKKMYRKLMPHHSPAQFREIVKQYGANLDQYYGFPHDAWLAFIAKYPHFAGQLDEIKDANVAAMLETAAWRLVRRR